MVHNGGHDLTVVIPTCNESPNLGPLFKQFAIVREASHLSLQVVVVDDASPDGTARLAEDLGRRHGIPTRVIVRGGPRSLGGAIVEGMRSASTDLVCVMDADLSHPPSLLPQMVHRLNGFDGVVASRYATGGRIPRWPVHRRVISLAARAMAARVVRTESTDPASGFFLFRRSSIQGLPLTGLGHKPLFEILSHANLTIYELPYVFQNRERGRSKLDGRGVLEFARLTMVLWRARSVTDRRREASEKGVPAAPRGP